jgi:hypothetical protein
MSRLLLNINKNGTFFASIAAESGVLLAYPRNAAHILLLVF